LEFSSIAATRKKTIIMKSIKLGIVGATGMVGETFLQLLDERKTPLSELRLFASEQSLGKKVPFRGNDISLQVLAPGCFDGLDVVFFSSGDPISKEWAPIAVKAGAYAIDNSAAFRMDVDTALVVPEINLHHLKDQGKPQIIANPNCSTIQLVIALNAFKKMPMESLHVASYQSVSGAGKEAVDDLKNQSTEILNQQTPQPGKNFVKPIGFDVHPIIGGLDDDGFCSEENKIVAETKKILSQPNLKVSAFTARVPTLNSHAEALWVTFKNPVSKKEIEAAFASHPEIHYLPASNEFHSLPYVSGKNDVYVSRLRAARDFPNTWMMWIVADNIRRGAATNGLYIAEELFKG
jgi:aspartate-semialdehyde dehydrogenase